MRVGWSRALKLMVVLVAIILTVVFIKCGEEPVDKDDVAAETLSPTTDQNDWDANNNECDNGFDEDMDGYADYQGVPPGCLDDGDPNDCIYEPDSGCLVVIAGKMSLGESACRDGLDNDGDNLIDRQDFGCRACGFYDQDLDGEDWFTSSPECCDGIDNDGDGDTDIYDENSCFYYYDMIEEGKCYNGVDDDNDGFIDMYDIGCSGIHDNDETDPK